MNIRLLVRNALIASLYVLLTLLLQPISFGAWQLRLSEGLTLLPLAMPGVAPALAVGCLIANTLGGAVPLDIVFGTAATLAAAYLTQMAGRHFKGAAAIIAGGLCPVVLNMFITAPIIVYFYLGGGNAAYYVLYMAVFALCEAAAVFAAGIPMLLCAKTALKAVSGKAGRKSA